jgi:hypothetical protein
MSAMVQRLHDGLETAFRFFKDEDDQDDPDADSGGHPTFHPVPHKRNRNNSEAIHGGLAVAVEMR